MSQDGASDPGLGSRFGSATAMVVLLMAIPLLAGLLLGGRSAAVGAVLGSFLTFLMAAAAGTSTAARMAPWLLVVVTVASATSKGTIWVVLLVLCALATGWAGRHGLLGAVALFGVATAVAPSYSGAPSLAAQLLFGALGAANGIVLARRLGMPEQRRGEQMTPRLAVGTAVVLGVSALAAGLGTIAWGAPYAYWLPMTVFLLAVPSTDLLAHQRAGHRVVGALVGVAVGAALQYVGPSRWLGLLVGLLLLIASLAVPQPLWLSRSFSNAATVVLLTAGGASSDVGWDRLQAVAIGSGLVVASIVLTVVVARVLWPSREQQRLAAEFDPAGVGQAGRAG